MRRLERADLDHELLWCGVSLAVLAAGASWRALGLPWPSCLFHALTGHPCATCGATRSAIAFSHGQFLAAWRWNPLACVTYCALVIFNVYALVVVITHAPRLRVLHIALGEKRFLRASVVALVLANWIYLLIANR